MKSPQTVWIAILFFGNMSVAVAVGPEPVAGRRWEKTRRDRLHAVPWLSSNNQREVQFGRVAKRGVRHGFRGGSLGGRGGRNCGAVSGKAFWPTYKPGRTPQGKKMRSEGSQLGQMDLYLPPSGGQIGSGFLRLRLALAKSYVIPIENRQK